MLVRKWLNKIEDYFQSNFVNSFQQTLSKKFKKNTLLSTLRCKPRGWSLFPTTVRNSYFLTLLSLRCRQQLRKAEAFKLENLNGFVNNYFFPQLYISTTAHPPKAVAKQIKLLNPQTFVFKIKKILWNLINFNLFRNKLLGNKIMNYFLFIKNKIFKNYIVQLLIICHGKNYCINKLNLNFEH